MPGPLIRRWTLGAGGFIGEVSLFELSEEDAYVGEAVELSNLYVHPLRRGRGWAESLLITALDYADRRNWSVFLRAIPYGTNPSDLDRLIKFYRSHGFRQLRRGDKRELIRW